jgi:hypothetical protein
MQVATHYSVLTMNASLNFQRTKLLKGLCTWVKDIEVKAE